MNGPDHYREAERLLDEATSRGDFNPRAQWCLELAKLHTALAHVAATALTSDGREWAEVAGSRFGVVPMSGQRRLIRRRDCSDLSADWCAWQGCRLAAGRNNQRLSRKASSGSGGW